MPDWLFEGRQTIYLILACLAMLFLVVWTRSGFLLLLPPGPQQRRAGKERGRLALPPIALGVILLLMVTCALLDPMVETPREQMRRRVREMAAAVSTRDAKRINQHLSPQFRRGSLNRDAFAKFVEQALADRVIESLEVWNFTYPGERGRIDFFAKPRGGLANGAAYFLVRATFTRDPDGQWRLSGFEVFKPYSDSKTPLTIPRLPG